MFSSTAAPGVRVECTDRVLSIEITDDGRPRGRRPPRTVPVRGSSGCASASPCSTASSRQRTAGRRVPPVRDHSYAEESL